MSEYSTIVVSTESRVATIQLNRPRGAQRAERGDDGGDRHRRCGLRR